jgi:hypothetical protein
MRNVRGIVVVAGALAAWPTASAQRGTNLAEHCLGTTRAIPIASGRIGALPLDISLDSLRRLCPSVRDTTANTYEQLNRAIKISAPTLSVIGITSVLSDEGGDHPPDSAGGRQHVSGWFVRGRGGLLPKGIPTNASWPTLHHAYGRALVQTETAELVVTFCELPGLVFTMSGPLPLTLNWKVVDSDTSLPAGSHVIQVDVSKAIEHAADNCPSAIHRPLTHQLHD